MVCPGRLAWLGRHPFKVEIMGSKPIRGTNTMSGPIDLFPIRFLRPCLGHWPVGVRYGFLPLRLFPVGWFSLVRRVPEPKVSPIPQEIR
jgi:hypothetical protein